MLVACCMCVRSKTGLGQLNSNIQAITGKPSFSPAAAALARTSRSSTVPVRGSPPAFLSRSALASDLTRPTASMRFRDIKQLIDIGLSADNESVLSLHRTAMFGRRRAKANLRCAHVRSAGPHTDMVPFGQEELDHRSPTISCGTCHEYLHDASLGLLRAAIVRSRNTEMKDRKWVRGRFVYRRSMRLLRKSGRIC